MAAVKFAAPVALAWVTAAVSALATGVWGAVLFAQTSGGTSIDAGTIIPAAALTGTSGALVWVVKQIVGGNLVHRDPERALEEVARATHAAAKAAAEAARVAEQSLEREDRLFGILTHGRPRHDQ